MSAIARRTAQIARRTRPSATRNARSYASESHGKGHGSDHGHHEAPVEEGLGTAFYIAVGAIPASMLVYSISRPGKDGEPNAVTKLWNSFSGLNETWETRNALRTQMMEQAAHDRHLLYNAPINPHYELPYPEVFQHGSQLNVPAGHYPNIDKVVEHYRKQHLDAEEAKAKKLATKKSE
ncbi:hypothetical protein P8C59_003940 [Phyllachora maydis]|uniref:Uncharacterized protein n=1 Tax=Phyllachora maydis TaxID=1825666 RepID=A0AAD9I2D8_9PEZI|nr:hypothetical protein P8C59_003940 [Phyllachora maydis]